jgi:hypothetical protein
VLGDDVDAVLGGLGLESAAAEASGGAKFRKQPTAAALALWSRSWLARLEALHATQVGNYVAALPLVRAAADYTAAELAMLDSEAAEWVEWLEGGGVSPAHELHATEFRLHAFRSAETLARYTGLGRVYRESSDLSMPHFGATLLVTANESTPERVLVTFGERDFHLGMAELVLGWLLTLGVESLAAVGRAGPQLAPVDPGTAADWTAQAGRLIDRRDRCRIEEVEFEGAARQIVAGWRKRDGDAARRILL